MRRIMFMLAMICALGVKAQRVVLTVRLTDGSSVQYDNNKVKKVEFRNDREWGELPDGGYGDVYRSHILFTFNDNTTDDYYADKVTCIDHETMDEELHNGYPYVDLGLPSGVKWAKYNVGAIAPEEYGWFMAWGETENKEEFYAGNYKYCDADGMLTKYNLDEKTGVVDGKKVLDPEDDVAHVQWGGDWHIPSYDEIHEMQVNCRFETVELNGVKVMRATAACGNSIYLPLGGHKFDGPSDITWWDKDTDGYFWSNQMPQRSTPDMLGGERSWFVEVLEAASTTPAKARRSMGCMVRPVFGGK